MTTRTNREVTSNTESTAEDELLPSIARFVEAARTLYGEAVPGEVVVLDDSTLLSLSGVRVPAITKMFRFHESEREHDLVFETIRRRLQALETSYGDVNRDDTTTDSDPEPRVSRIQGATSTAEATLLMDRQALSAFATLNRSTVISWKELRTTLRMHWADAARAVARMAAADLCEPESQVVRISPAGADFAERYADLIQQ